MLKLRESGDTIIEVLLSMAVVSSVLSGAYVTVRRGLDNSRQAQERAEGLKVVESQLEQLKSSADSSNPTSPIFAPTTSINDFCMGPGNVPINALAGAGRAPSLDAETPDFSNYVMDCKLNGPPAGYNVSISRNANDFTVRSRWNKAGGGKDQVQIIYRILP
jgi:type II secretory pathway pseudopilin PulG